jgi:hypothetical protein
MGDLRKIVNAIEARGGQELMHETVLIDKQKRLKPEASQ